MFLEGARKQELDVVVGLRRNGPWETRFVVANFEAPGRILARWGRRCNMSDMW